MSFQKIEIKNFSVFELAEFDFSPQINVFIGENGTGKTQLLKLLYLIPVDSGKIQDYFGCDASALRRNQKEFSLTVSSISDEGRCFIPAKDMLTHTKGFIPVQDKFHLPFDKTLSDIVKKALLPNLKKIPPLGLEILPKLEQILGGRVCVENEVFFIEKPNGVKIPFSTEAEGIKKFATLWQLIMNESIQKGGVLLWDEPEANINPKLLKNVVEILLELARHDVQIFVSTHSYVFAKYMEILQKDVEVLYHGLYKGEEDDVAVETVGKFSWLEHNAIISENLVLYETEVMEG